MDPITAILLGGSVFAGGYGGAMILNKVIDYVVPTKYQPQFKAQKERDERLEEFQKQFPYNN